METLIPAVRPPQQKRSRETFDRILQATEDLMRDKEFDAITIAEIALRAKSSIGAFYARFPSKEALLPALYERLSERIRVEYEKVRDPSAWGERSLTGRVEAIAARIIHGMRAARPVLRPLALYARQHPDAVTPEDRNLRGAAFRVACAALLECRDDIRHPDPELAVEFAVYAISAIARDKILFGDAPSASNVHIEDETLQREAARMALAYLCGLPDEK